MAAAADGGFRAPEHSGTTSTATPGGRSAPPLVAGGPAPDERAEAQASRAHRMRIAAWLLGVTAILLLLAGLGALFTASSPGAAHDAEAGASLVTAFRRATDSPDYRPEVALTTVERNSPSSAPRQVSIDRTDSLWVGAAKSASGRCFLLAVRLSDGVRGVGTLGQDEPCTGAQVRLRAEKKLADAKA